MCQVGIGETSESKPIDEASKRSQTMSKPGSQTNSGNSSEETCLLSERHPVYRWRESDMGFYRERENLLFG